MAAEAVELGCDPGQGYHVQVIGGHDVVAAMLVEQLRLQVRDEIGASYLEPNPPEGVTAHMPQFTASDSGFARVVSGSTVRYVGGAVCHGGDRE